MSHSHDCNECDELRDFLAALKWALVSVPIAIALITAMAFAVTWWGEELENIPGDMTIQPSPPGSVFYGIPPSDPHPIAFGRVDEEAVSVFYGIQPSDPHPLAFGRVDDGKGANGHREDL